MMEMPIGKGKKEKSPTSEPIGWIDGKFHLGSIVATLCAFISLCADATYTWFQGWVLISLLLVGVLGEAQSLENGSGSLQTQKGDRLFIKGFSGKLTLIGTPQKQRVFVRVTRPNAMVSPSVDESDWRVSFRRAGRHLELIVRGPQSKLDWDFRKGSGRPRFEVFVESPPMLAEIHWQEAMVRIQGWKSDIVASVGSGRVEDLNGSGTHRVSLQNGHLKVESHRGELELESYKGRVTIFKSQSRVNLENFAGMSHFERVSGEIQLTSYKGRTRMKECEGRFEFKNIQSSVKIEKFKGTIRGESRQGVIRLSTVGEAHIHVKSEEGAVHLHLPDSAAKVNLGSSKGGIYAPKFLKLTRLPKLKTMRGQLRGTQPGDVYVRTHSGKIFLK